MRKLLDEAKVEIRKGAFQGVGLLIVATTLTGLGAIKAASDSWSPVATGVLIGLAAFLAYITILFARRLTQIPGRPALVIPSGAEKATIESRIDDLHTDNTGRKAAMRRAIEAAKEEEARKPEIRVRVDRDRDETGNTASEPYRRWLHLKAENWKETAARDVRVVIRVRTNGDKGGWREWYWTGARQVMDVQRGSPVAIPVAVGDISEPQGPSGVAALLYRHEHYKIGNWFLTPQGHLSLLPIAPGRYWVDVEVKWSDQSVEDNFILDLPEKGSKREAELIHTVGKELY